MEFCIDDELNVISFLDSHYPNCESSPQIITEQFESILKHYNQMRLERIKSDIENVRCIMMFSEKSDNPGKKTSVLSGSYQNTRFV